MFGCRDGGEKLCLADTQFAFFPLRLKVSCYVTRKGHVTDRQHQCQGQKPEAQNPSHGFILNELTCWP